MGKWKWYEYMCATAVFTICKLKEAFQAICYLSFSASRATKTDFLVTWIKSRETIVPHAFCKRQTKAIRISKVFILFWNISNSVTIKWNLNPLISVNIWFGSSETNPHPHLTQPVVNIYIFNDWVVCSAKIRITLPVFLQIIYSTRRKVSSSKNRTILNFVL